MALAPMHLPAAPDRAVGDASGAVTRPRITRRRLPQRRTRLERLARPDTLATPSSMALIAIGERSAPHR